MSKKIIKQYFKTEHLLAQKQNLLEKHLGYEVGGYGLQDYTAYYWELAPIIPVFNHENNKSVLFISKVRNNYHLKQVSEDASSHKVVFATSKYTIVSAYPLGFRILLDNSKRRGKVIRAYTKREKNKLKERRKNERVQKKILKIRAEKKIKR